MEFKEVTLCNVKIDEEFVLKGDKYRAVCKVKKDNITNIMLMEMTEDRYLKIKDKLDNKELTFSVKGNFVITKNKKDIPYVLFSINYINDDISIETNKKENEKLYDDKLIEKYKKSIELENRVVTNKKKKVLNLKSICAWSRRVDDIENKIKLVDISEVLVTDELHKQPVTLNLKGESEDYIHVLAVEKIEGSDKFSLVSGINGYVISKILNKKVNIYVIETDKESFRNDVIKYIKEVKKTK